MAFPASPVDGQEHNKYIYNSTTLSWEVNVSKPTVFPSNDRLLAHYSFDEGSGVGGAVATYHLDGNALDLSGNGNHGTEYNSPTYETGKSNQGVMFDGVNQYISTTQEVIGTKDFWVSFWVKPDLATRNDGLIGGGSPAAPSGNGWTINYRGDIANNPLHLTFNDGNVTPLISAFSPSVGDLTGVFNHIFVNFDRSDSVSIYLNNVFIDSIDISGYIGSLTGASLNIGRQGNHLVYMDGIVDEVNFGIGRTLSQAEITELYNNPSNQNLNQPKLPTGAIGEWDLNGDSNDTSGNGNHGVDLLTTYSQGRKDNQAAEWAGSVTGYIDVGNVSVLNTKDIQTVSFNMLVESISGTSDIPFTNGTINISGWYISIFDTGAVNLTINGISTNQVHASSTGLFDFGEWNSFVFEVDYGNLYVKSWLNSVLIHNSAITITPIKNSTQNIYFGNYILAGTFNLDGKMEAIKFFDKVLTEQEILALAEQTNPVKDNSGNNNDGYSVGQLSSVQGVAGKALAFNSSKYVTLPPQDFGIDDFSVTLWLSPSTIETGTGILISNRVATDTWWRLGRAGDKIGLEVANSFPTQYFGLSSSGVLAVEEYAHAVLVRKSNVFQLFVNGVADNTLTQTVNLSNGNPIVMGVYNYTLQPFIGNQDEVRIYNRALSAEEVRGLYEYKK